MNGFNSPLTSGNIQYIFAFIIVVLAGVIVYLNSQVSKLNDKMDAIQAARLQDAKEMTDKITGPLTSISQTMNLIYDKLRVGRR